MNKEERNIGLVLSGGGARGAYQIGVWEGLKELGLERRLHTVAGVSIGAINAAVLIQEWNDGPETAIDMWRQMLPGEVFKAVPDNLKNLEWKDYLDLGLDSLKNFKVRVDPFIERLFEHTSEERIREAPHQFVLAAWNLNKLRTDVFPLPEIPQGKLADYILASASFPAFGSYKIDGTSYLDGGIGNNLPLDLALKGEAIDLGLAIDVGAIVRYSPSQLRVEKKYKEQTLIIRPSRSIPSPANFSSSAVQIMLEVGYEDGKKHRDKVKSFFSL
ncbi:MAG TPA: patatin-like phospholipase family protein [Saprospiraceae bacterium]|nr:patatin-like phospholipase family protein [Saprospiraceae bacterium]